MIDYTNWKPPEKAPPLASHGDTIRLHHYGPIAPDAAGRLVVDPTRFGRNKWTQAEAKAVADPHRSFFYAGHTNREMFFEGARHHTVDYPTKHLYDLLTDPDGLVAKHGSVNKVLHDLRDRGYHGVYYGEYHPVVAMWHPVEVHHVPDTQLRLSRQQAPRGGMVANNLFVKGGRFTAKPLGRVRRIMDAIRNSKLKLSRQVDESLTPGEAARVQKMKEPTYAAHRRMIDRAAADRPGLLPTSAEVRALAQHGESVRGGYDDAHKLMTDLLPHPGDAHRWAAINAVLSANTSWLSHTEGATHALALWHRAGRPTSEAALNALFGATYHDGSKIRFVPETKHVLTHGTPRLVKKLLPEDAHAYAQLGLAPDNYFAPKAHKLKKIFAKGDDYEFDPKDVADGSLKTPNFALAHFSPYGVPIDTHMAKLLSPKGPADAERHVGSKSLLAVQKRLATNHAAALAYKSLIAHSAREMGWEPRQVQEAVWVAVLALMTAKKRGAGGDYGSLAAAVHRTAMRSGWDMHTVMRSPTMLQALLHLGSSGEKLYRAVEASRARHPVPQPVRPTTGNEGAVEAAARRLPAVVSAAARPIDRAMKLSRHGGHGSFDALLRLALLAATGDDEEPLRLARKRGGPYEKELRPWVASVARVPEDRVRRGALADWLEENGHHHDDATLATLREHDGPVVVARHLRSGKVVAARSATWDELQEHRRARGQITQPQPSLGWTVHHIYRGSAGFGIIASHEDEPDHHSVHFHGAELEWLRFPYSVRNDDGHGPTLDVHPKGPRPLPAAHALAAAASYGV